MFFRKEIKIYAASNERVPFIEWLDALYDKQTRYRIKERLDRASLGNMGDYKYIDEGVSEMRLPFGQGYRIYYTDIDRKTILLLHGGSKSTQERDIIKAIGYWQDYLSR